MSTNKDYREHKNGENIIYSLYEMLDNCEVSIDNIKYWEDIETVKERMKDCIDRANIILEWLK